MQYRTKRIDKKNLIELFRLFNDEHGSKYSLKYFYKKFETSWTKKSYIGYFAVSENNEIGAFYGGFPCKMKINGDIKLVLQSGDTITKKNHRKRGLFLQLAKETYILAENNGFDLVFGFPNQNSSHGFFNKLEWHNIGNLTHFTFTFNHFNWFGLCHKFRLLTPLYNFFWNRKIKKHEITASKYSRSINQEYNGVLKDEDFIQYKLNYGHSHIIDVDNNYFWIKRDNGILLGDLIIKYEFDDFYNILRPLARKFGVKQIHFACNNNHPMFQKLMDSVAERKPGSIIGLRQFKNENINVQLAFVSGDSDDF
jgi:hypothetical protein